MITISCNPPGAKLRKAAIKLNPNQICKRYAKKAAMIKSITEIIAP